jgi:hypothetical protein
MTASLTMVCKPAQIRLLERNKRNLRMVCSRIKIRMQVRSVRLPVNLTNHRELTNVTVEVVENLNGDVSKAIRRVVVVGDGTSQVHPNMLDH